LLADAPEAAADKQLLAGIANHDSLAYLFVTKITT